MAKTSSKSSPLLPSESQLEQQPAEPDEGDLTSLDIPTSSDLPLLSPSVLVRPDSDAARPKPLRSVTFDPNPVSQTINLSPTPSPPTRPPHPPFAHSPRRKSNTNAIASSSSSQTAPTLPAALTSSEPTPYGSLSATSIPRAAQASLLAGKRSVSGGAGNSVGSGTGSGTGSRPPVFAALNSRLRRRNSSGSVPVSRQQMQQFQQQYQQQYSGAGMGPGMGSTSMAMAPDGAALPPLPPPPKIGPQRSSKNAQKLKLLPNPEFGDDGPDEESGRDVYSQYTRIKDPTARRDAAFLGKADRGRLPRVTAYCTANRYEMDSLLRFLKGRSKTRGANPKLIDECIYTPYNYDYGKSASNGSSNNNPLVIASRREQQKQKKQKQQQEDVLTEHRDDLIDLEGGASEEDDGAPNRHLLDEESIIGVDEHTAGQRRRRANEEASERTTQSTSGDSTATFEDSTTPANIPTTSVIATVASGDEQILDLNTHVRTPEVFLFDYGVIVIWGMSEVQEQRFLKELARFETEKLAPDDVEAEFFNFYYTREYQARIYNDFIALRDDRNGGYMAKLSISHALAQSVKTSLFEELIASTIETCKDIPTQIALTGTIALSRTQINMQIGELFILRINIHLNGSVLDTPELFWVEPQLEPMYQAVRSYLEMDQRVGLLTQRLDVIADLLAVLKEQLSHGHGEKLEWIVIILIAAEILVAAINIVVDVYADD